MRIPRKYPGNAPTSWVRMCRIIGKAIYSRPVQKRYPLQPLIDILGMSEAAMARRVGLSGSSLVKARTLGFTEAAADRYAVRAGFVPWMVWPEWLDDAIADVSVVCAAEDCDVTFIPSRKGHRCCSDRCSKLHHKRTRYRDDPEFAESVRQRRRAHYEECVEYERAASRLNHQRNRDRRLEGMRAYYRENAEELKAKQRARYAAKKAA